MLKYVHPRWHQDTYVEEYHRSFFNNYASGKPLLSCGIPDYHIGGLSQIPALLASMEALDQNEPSAQLESVLSLIRLTRDHEYTLRAATDLTRICRVSNTWRIDPALDDYHSLRVSVNFFKNGKI